MSYGRATKGTLRALSAGCRRRQYSTARPDPFKLVEPQLNELRTSLLSLLGSGHAAISEVTKYYFQHRAKHVRPVIVLLLSQATNGLGSDWSKKLWEAQNPGGGGLASELDEPLTRPDVLNDWNPSMPDGTSPFTSPFPLQPLRAHRHPPVSPQHLPAQHSPSLHLPPYVLPTQMRLAQIVEMLHTASLLHDDVIDESALRRGAPSAPAAFDNKQSVLGGNFVLGRASAALSRLGDEEVTQLIASVISNLVEGEILQLKEIRLDGSPEIAHQTRQDAWNIYLHKTYLKTASLMAKGARSAVVLGGCKEGEIWKEIAYAYGRNLGIAFQLVDDVLDYESASATLGKPGGADLELGLATGPALYAWEEYPEIGELICRKFEQPGDVERARALVLRSSGVERTKSLAEDYATKAREVLQELPDSDAKSALEVLTQRVVGRRS